MCRHDKHTAEDIVRRATAAFNAGQPDEARKLCEQGLRRQPGDPMLNHLLAAVLFSQGEIRAGARATSRPAWPNGPTMPPRICWPRASPAPPGISMRAVASRSGHRDRAAAGGISRKGADAGPGRSAAAGARGVAGDPGSRSADIGGRGAARTTGVGGWRPRRRRSLARTRGGRRCARIGLVRSRPRPPGSARPRRRRGAPTARRSRSKPDHAEAALNLGIVLQEGGDLDGAMRAYAQAYRLRPRCSAPSRWR